MPNDHDEKDGGAPATSVPLSRREMLAVSVSGLVVSPEASTLLGSIPAAAPAAAAAKLDLRHKKEKPLFCTFMSRRE